MRSEDEARFRDMARRQAVPMRRFAYLLCGDWHLAEDLVQNALTKLYSAWWRIRGADALDRYVRKTVVRCWLDEVRRPWRRAEDRTGVVPDVADHDGDPAAVGQRAQTRDLVLRALAEVPSRQRAVLVLRYFEDLSVADTAAALGCSEGTVKSQASRGLDNLRAVIARSGLDSSALAGGRTES